MADATEALQWGRGFGRAPVVEPQWKGEVMHGSLINRLTEGPTRKVPKVGMPATIMFYSDREPGTIIEVKTFKSGLKKDQPKEFVVQFDHWKVVKGNEGDGSAQYEYERNPDGRTMTFSFNEKRQRWIEARTEGRGCGVILDHRERHHDPHF